MGFWSSVGSFFSGVGRAICSIGSSFIGTVSKIFDWFSSAKELKEAPRYDEKKATIDETLKMNELLEKQRTGFTKTISSLENDIAKKSEEIFNELLRRAEESNQEYETSIHISFLKNQFEDYISKMKGSLASKVNHRIQISDSECSSLLKLEGTIREEKIDLYIKTIIKEGMNKYISELEYDLKKTLDLFEHAIKEKTGQKGKEIDSLLADINNVEFSKNIGEKESKRKELSAKNQDIEKLLFNMGKIELAKN